MVLSLSLQAVKWIDAEVSDRLLPHHLFPLLNQHVHVRASYFDRRWINKQLLEPHFVPIKVEQTDQLVFCSPILSKYPRFRFEWQRYLHRDSKSINWFCLRADKLRFSQDISTFDALITRSPSFSTLFCDASTRLKSVKNSVLHPVLFRRRNEPQCCYLRWGS